MSLLVSPVSSLHEILKLMGFLTTRSGFARPVERARLVRLGSDLAPGGTDEGRIRYLLYVSVNRLRRVWMKSWGIERRTEQVRAALVFQI